MTALPCRARAARRACGLCRVSASACTSRRRAACSCWHVCAPEPGREFHVLDFGRCGHQRRCRPVARRTRPRRLPRAPGELSAERDAAESAGDLGRSERAAREIEALADAELERAFGLGRPRAQGSAPRASARAATSSAASRTPSSKCARLPPRLGEHLAASVRTGTYCSYTPPTALPLTAARRRP